MRSVLAISLPERRKDTIVSRAKKSKQSVSAYILSMLDLMENLISEDELLKMARDGESDYKQGKTKKLNSLADLMN